MSIFKCKMCGGNLEVSEGASVATCEYCGTTQTLPRLGDDKIATLYERADHFRRNNDFDKAIAVYEQILNEDNTDAEAFWSLVLCRYGVEYVEDPKDGKRIATVNRMQYTSVLADEDYKSALKYSSPEQKAIYEMEAKEIDVIQKGILAISQREEPFDVFICYKETDANGRRTPDSVLANELYHQLTGEGYKVFFSRITLEDKLGTAYEPYIFAALNSAKVMVVIGTKPDYFNAVWVRNEWSRFLALIKSGANKVLIPAYRDMDPYNLPEEFSNLQAQDMSKLGFMQDLIRGIEKIAGRAKPQYEKEQPAASGVNTASLLRRVFLFLEDGDFASADEYCEKTLDIDAECGEAYLGKLMASLKVRRREALSECANTFENNPNYQKALRFGDEKLKRELEGHLKDINDRNERTRLVAIYKKGENLFKSARTEVDYLAAAAIFASVSAFEDAKEREQTCKAKADELHSVGIYNVAVALMTGGKVKNFKKAIAEFEKIPNFKDSAEKIEYCNKQIERINGAVLAAGIERKKRAEENSEALKQKLPLFRKIALIVAPILIIAIIAGLVLPQIDWSKKEPTNNSSSATISAEKPSSNITSSEAVNSSTDSSVTDGDSSSVQTESSKPANSSKPATSKPVASSKPSTSTQTKDYHGKVIKNNGSYTVKCNVSHINCGDPLLDISIKNGKVTIEKIYIKCEENDDFAGDNIKITLPQKIANFPVTQIGKTTSTSSRGEPVIDGSKDKGLWYVESLTIPSSVKIIGASAFSNSIVYGSIELPSGLEYVGAYAFEALGYGYGSFSITIPESVTTIGNYAFTNFQSSGPITINAKIDKLPDGMFYGSQVRTVTIKHATKIGKQVFLGCHVLVNVNSPALVFIGDDAFKNCLDLNSVNLANGCDIADGAFIGTKFDDTSQSTTPEYTGPTSSTSTSSSF